MAKLWSISRLLKIAAGYLAKDESQDTSCKPYGISTSDPGFIFRTWASQPQLDFLNWIYFNQKIFKLLWSQVKLKATVSNFSEPYFAAANITGEFLLGTLANPLTHCLTHKIVEW